MYVLLYKIITTPNLITFCSIHFIEQNYNRINIEYPLLINFDSCAIQMMKINLIH